MRKKILFIIWSFSMGGGAEKILSSILNNLNLDKYEVDVLEYIRFNIKKETIPTEISLLKPVIDCTTHGNKIKRKIFDSLVFHNPELIRKLYVKKQYDVEIGFNYLIPSALISKKTKSICWFHGDINDLIKNDYLYKKQGQYINEIDRIITISENSYNSIYNLYPEYINKVSIIHNGFNLKEIKLKSNEFTDYTLPKNSFISIGRLENEKGILDTVQCFIELLKEKNDCHLYVLGEGSLRKEIEQLVSKEKLNSNIHILGYIQNPYPIMKQALGIISFSKSEGFPTIFAEGLALGVPFISTDVGGAKELSNDGKCGKVFFDRIEAKEIIKNVLSKKYVFEKKVLLNHINNYSIYVQIKKIENLIDTINL